MILTENSEELETHMRPRLVLGRIEELGEGRFRNPPRKMPSEELRTHGETLPNEVSQVVVVREGWKQVVWEVRELPCGPYDGTEESEREQRR